jgi:hypothetical protein
MDRTSTAMLTLPLELFMKSATRRCTPESGRLRLALLLPLSPGLLIRTAEPPLTNSLSELAMLVDSETLRLRSGLLHVLLMLLKSKLLLLAAA